MINVIISGKRKDNPPQAPRSHPWRSRLGGIALATAALVGLGGCSPHKEGVWQGYLEGEYVYVSSPIGGSLESLPVSKGTRVAAGTPLFTLEHAAETAQLHQVEEQLAQARSQLADLQKGQRPEEIAALEARVGRARAAEELSGLELGRQEALFRNHAVAASEYDRARLNHEADLRAVEEDQAQLATARLGARSDALKAAEANVRAAEQSLAHARWTVDQKSQAAPVSGLVFDTLYRVGEYVPAGVPVVSLLPPGNIKARFFVAEGDFARLKLGAKLQVAVAEDRRVEATLTYLSPQAEYTPPVLYNQDNRAKLVYMAEAQFDPNAAADLHPGLPVDVRLSSP